MPRALGQIDTRKSEAILDAASEVLSERGLGASVEEIARRACVSKQTVYNHFGGLPEIVRALAERRSGVVTAPLAEPGAAEDPEAALYGYARSLLEAVTSPRHLEVMRLTILTAREHPELAEIIFTAGARTSRRRLAEFLGEEHEAGRLHVIDPSEAAELFRGMALGSFQLQALLHLGAPDEPEIEHRARACAAAFMRLYAPTQAAAITGPAPPTGR